MASLTAQRALRQAICHKSSLRGLQYSSTRSSAFSAPPAVSEPISSITMSGGFRGGGYRGYYSGGRGGHGEVYQRESRDRGSFSRGGGGGGGRGAYYKAKYGNKSARSSNGHYSQASGNYQGQAAVPKGSWNPASDARDGKLNDVQSVHDLRRLLESLERAPYGAYKQLMSKTYQFELPAGFGVSAAFTATFVHVQGDSYAPPSGILINAPCDAAGFPEKLHSNHVRRVALADYLTRKLHVAVSAGPQGHRGTGWATAKGGAFTFHNPSCFVLERTAVAVDATGGVTARLKVALPARGRSILGNEAAEMLADTLPDLVRNSLTAAAHDLEDVRQFIEIIEDQEHLRQVITQSPDMVAFIGNGSILPRAAGDSEAPLSDAVPWQSPDTISVTLDRPNGGPITGTAVRRGITAIIGGGFHGKSTLLQALSAGVQNKIPCDGREWIVTDKTAVIVRSEDGRKVSSVDVSPFIRGLPGRAPNDTQDFSTENASGSTSLAAGISEAIECGSRLMLLDEDNCATNAMVRDVRMASLVPGEPIAPLVCHVRALTEIHKVSCVVVVGSSSDLVATADSVLSMEEYRAVDLTQRARKLLGVPPKYADPAAIARWDTPRLARAVAWLPDLGAMKVTVRSVNRAAMGVEGHEWDLSTSGAMLVEVAQMRWLVDVVIRLRQGGGEGRPLTELLDHMDAATLEDVGKLADNWYARPRRQDIAMALNRLRSARFQQVPNSVGKVESCYVSD